MKEAIQDPVAVYWSQEAYQNPARRVMPTSTTTSWTRRIWAWTELPIYRNSLPKLQLAPSLLFARSPL